jgi:tetratricopeptide (TPR) repeat protein
VPELLAQHAEEAGLIESAVGYLLEAGKTASSHSANREAMTSLERGLALLRSIAGSAERDRLELKLQIAFGHSQQMVRGRGSLEVRAAYARAEELAERVGDRSERLMSAYGSYFNQLIRLELSDAKRSCDTIHAIAVQDGNKNWLMISDQLLGTYHLWRGEHIDATKHLRAAMSSYDPSEHAALTGLIVWDVYAFSATRLAKSLSYQGFRDQAYRIMQDGIDHARAVGHANTLALALQQAVILGAEQRDGEYCRTRIRQFWELSAGMALGPFAETVNAAEAWASDDLSAEPLARISSAHDTIHKIQPVSRSLVQILMARVLFRRHRHGEAKTLLDHALAIIEQTGEWLRKPELLHLRGEAAAHLAECDDAERPLTAAIDLARSQSARLIELRASTSLARLWAEQGERQKAHDLLAPIHAWFTEGFDTPDLIEAKALLDQLG